MKPEPGRFVRRHTVATLVDASPPVRALTSRLSPGWFFRITRWSVLASSFWPHSRRRARYFRETLRGHLPCGELRARTRRFLYHARLVKDVEVAWSFWGHQHQDWIALQGEEHLRAALEDGRGAVLLSPHNYGYSKLVAPVLSARGYEVQRGGNGGKKARYRVQRWGKNRKLGWSYLNYKGDYWHRVQVLKAMQQALQANGVVHVSPRAYARGDERMAVDVFGRKYYLDAGWFKIFRICGAPLLPCFAVADWKGRFRITIHPRLSASDESAAAEFSAVARETISGHPECGRLWKSLHVKKEKW